MTSKFRLFFVIAVLTLAGVIFVMKVPTVIAFTVLTTIGIALLSIVRTELALYILVISMLLGPQFIVGDATVLPGRGRAGITLRLDDFLIVVIGLCWFLKTAIRKELGLFLRTPLNKPIALYFLICLFSTLLASLMGRGRGYTGLFFVLKYFEYFVVYFMAVNHIKTREQIERFIFIMLIVCFIVCLTAIYQIPAGGRVSAPFEGPEGEPNTLGGYLVLMLSIVSGLLLADVPAKRKVSLAVLALAIVVSLGATLSRGSWVSLPPMIMTLLYFSKKKMMLIAVMLAIILLTPFILPTTVKDRVLYTVGQSKETGQVEIGKVRIDTSTSARLYTWQNILTRDFLKHPLIGYGVTNYGFVDAQIPRVLIETGALGLAAFFVMLYAIYQNALRAFHNVSDPFFRGISLGYLAGFAAMLAHSIGANTFIIVRIMEPFWFLTAMITMIPKIEMEAMGKNLS